MGKFAGFLQRLKNIPGVVAKGIVKGLGKINDVYKVVKPYAKPLADLALNFVPGGFAIGVIAEQGLDKASNTIDTLVYNNNSKPGTILPMLPSDKINKNDIINKDHPITPIPKNLKTSNEVPNEIPNVKPRLPRRINPTFPRYYK